MPYTVVFVADARDDLKRLNKIIAQRILSKLKWLAENLDTITPDVLTGQWQDAFKLRVGDYRVIYTVERSVITVHAVGHRREVYR
jgi:mRNA interferase RelE/StbE